MKMTPTAKNKLLWLIFTILSIIATTVPLLVYGTIGFVNATTTEKAQMSMIAICSLIIVVYNIIAKQHMRSPLWIAVLAIHMVLDNIQPLLILTAVGTILDEFVFIPLKAYYHSKFTINSEIDKRLGNG